MDGELECAVRQAGVIYLKNMVVRFWEHDENDTNATEQQSFVIHEQDRHVIREHIVEAIILSPEPIRLA